MELVNKHNIFINQLKSLIDAYEESEKESHYFSPEDIVEELNLSIEDDPLWDDAVLDLMKAIVIRTPKSANRFFFNQLYGGKEDIAVIADMMVARMNNSMYTFKVAGPHILIEISGDSIPISPNPR